MTKTVQYEYLFVDRKRIGGNIEAIMKDRKCTKVALSKAMNISRPTLDAFLRGDIRNAGKYDEYIRRLLVYLQVSDTVIDNYKSLPDIKKMRCNSVQKDVVKRGVKGLMIPYVNAKSNRHAYVECKKLLMNKCEALALSFKIVDAAKVIAELTEEFPEAYIGIADVTSREEASLAVDSGARFVFTNYAVKEVGTFCKERDVFCVMAATTLTEAYNASTMGSDVVNLYPFEAVAPSTIEAIHEDLPKLELMATTSEDKAMDVIGQYYGVLIR